jgi:hypothetical protein
MLIIILDLFFLIFWEWKYPAKDIDIAYDFNYEEYNANKERFGDHTF